MNEEICCITNKGKMANDDSDFLRALYSVLKNLEKSFSILINLFKQSYKT